jgi:hypothetical protein
VVCWTLRSPSVAHYRVHGHLCRWSDSDDLHPKRGSALLWLVPPRIRSLLGPQCASEPFPLLSEHSLTTSPAPTVLGNHRGATAANKTCRLGCICQLRVINQPLVLAILLPTLAGASLRSRWWHCHCWLRSVHCLLSPCSLVGNEEEQGYREGRREDWCAHCFPIHYLRSEQAASTME